MKRIGERTYEIMFPEARFAGKTLDPEVFLRNVSTQLRKMCANALRTHPGSFEEYILRKIGEMATDFERVESDDGYGSDSVRERAERVEPVTVAPVVAPVKIEMSADGPVDAEAEMMEFWKSSKGEPVSTAEKVA